jgi:gas vesicle protein
MADGYDRFENEGNGGGGSFVMGLLTGTVLGAGLGILFAPKAGSELRNQLSEQAGTLANQAQDGIRKVTENAGEWADRGRDMYGKAKDAVAKGADEAQRYVRETASTVKDTAVAAMPSSVGASGPAGSSYGAEPTYGSSTESIRGSESEPRGSSPSGTRRS